MFVDFHAVPLNDPKKLRGRTSNHFLTRLEHGKQGLNHGLVSEYVTCFEVLS